MTKADRFSTRLFHWRNGRKLIQRDAAKALDVPVWTYRSWENGKKTPGKLALCEIERRMEAQWRPVQ